MSSARDRQEGRESQNRQDAHTLRFSLVGYGYWGPQLARNFDRLPYGLVTHIVDLSPERRVAAQAAFPSAQVVADYAEVLDSDVDAVVIATPIRTHYRLAKQALERGKHVFVEKPLTASVAEAAELVALSRRLRLMLMVGHTFLYNPAVQELRKIVQSNSLGRIYHVDAMRLNLGIFQPDISVVWDLAPHDLSILGYILDAQPLRVSAHGGAYIRPGIHDVAHLMLQYPDNVLAHIHLSWLNPSKMRRFTVVGDRQMVVYDDVEATEKIRIYNRGVDAPEHTATFGEFQLSYRYGDIVSPYIHWSEPLAIECRHFVEAIQMGTPPQSDAYAGLQIVRILEAIERSLLLDGTSVPIEQDDGLSASANNGPASNC